MTKHKASAEQWAQIEGYAATDLHDDYAACLLDIRARVEALKANANSSVGLTSSTAAGSLARRFLVPPHGLVDEWFDRARRLPSTPLGVTRKVAEWAAQWGADQAIGLTFTAEAKPAPGGSPPVVPPANCRQRLQQQPEPIDESENDRRFKACMAAIDAATPEQIRAVTPPAAPAPAGGLWEAMHAAQERELADNPHAELAEVYGAMIRQVAAAALRMHPDPNLTWEHVAQWLEQEANRG